ncbi:cation-transporting P-type ATPase [Cyanobium sp. ATX 6A2]|uniref:cation-transporting P-type ATPase n=1 Tax=Cyanobium sp. ATX 6A2 TaxID=2823700 RepID=UPI0020CC2DE5|nr:cation-transporting P-type ATPase [Cyanobium sp. ATX 6A2]
MQLSASEPVWSLSAAGLCSALQTSITGLSGAEALARLERFGANRLPAQRRSGAARCCSGWPTRCCTSWPCCSGWRELWPSPPACPSWAGRSGPWC